MLKYFISTFFLFGLLHGTAQEKPVDTKPKDTTAYKQSYGIRAGIDLSRPILSSFDKDYTGFEIVADYRLTENLYIAAELGTEDKTKQEDLYNFTTTGSYLKLGLDQNTYSNWYGEHNSIFYGGRLAFSTFSQTLNNYQYFDTNRYWNPDTYAEGSNNSEDFTGRTATWVEGVFGTKVELFANIYMGASIRLGVLISDTDGGNDRFPNLWIPGFNKVTDGTRFGVGFNYSLSYFLPLYKKDKKPQDPDNEE